MHNPETDPLIYFDKKLNNDYHVIGGVDFLPNKFYGISPKHKIEVLLFIITIYAGKKEFFKKHGIPLTYNEYKNKFSTKIPTLISQQPLNSIKKENYSYIEKSIKENRDHFLISLKSEIIETPIENKKFKTNNTLPSFWAIYPLLKGNFEEKWKDFKFGKFYNYFNFHLWSTIVGEENSILMEEKEYQLALIHSSSIIHKLKDKTNLSDKDLKQLNKLNHSFLIRNNPFVHFTYSFFDSFLQFLRKKSLLKICPRCQHIFEYKKNKIYCSETCAKHVQYKRYYKQNHSEVLSKTNIRMKELRSFYKNHRINK